MPKPLISRRTQIGFREFLVGWTLREIGHEFDAEGVECCQDYDPGITGERRSYVEQFYHSLDLTTWEDAHRLLRVFESILNSTIAHNPEEAEKLSLFLKRDGFTYQDGRILTAARGLPSVGQSLNIATEFSTDYMLAQIERIQAAIDTDPDLAIGSAKELLETCCKTILADRGQPVAGNEDIPKLVKLTMAELELLPDDIPDEAKGAEAIKRLLSNLAGVVRGLAEVRNLYGSGHGRHGRASSVTPRHAKLAVGAATTLVVFLFETHRETQKEED